MSPIGIVVDVKLILLACKVITISSDVLIPIKFNWAAVIVIVSPTCQPSESGKLPLPDSILTCVTAKTPVVTSVDTTVNAAFVPFKLPFKFVMGVPPAAFVTAIEL